MVIYDCNIIATFQQVFTKKSKSKKEDHLTPPKTALNKIHVKAKELKTYMEILDIRKATGQNVVLKRVLEEVQPATGRRYLKLYKVP